MSAPKRELRDPPYDLGVSAPIPAYRLGASLLVRAGRVRCVEVVPTDDPEGAWVREEWDRTIEVYVSPQGWSTRVFVDGVEVV